MNYLKSVALVIFIYVVGVFVYATYFAFPQTDDFCIFGRVISTTGNPFSDTYYMYLNWAGRYTSMFFIALPAWVIAISPIEATIIYRLFVLIYLSSFFISIGLFFKVMNLDMSTNLLLTSIISGLIFIVLPSKVEGLYWLTGQAVYLLSASAFILLAAVLHLEYTKYRQNILPTWKTTFLLIFVVGFNELIAISAGILLACQYFLQTPKQRNEKKDILLVLVLVVSMLVTIFAPGNFVRSGGITIPKHDIAMAFELGTSSIGMLWKYNIGLHKSVVLFAILGGILVGISPRITPLFKSYRQALVLPITIIISIPIHLFLYSFLTGEATPGRTLNQSTELIWVGILILTVMISSFAAKYFQYWQQAYGDIYKNVVATGLIVVSIAFLNHQEFKNFNQTIREFAPQWANERFLRDQKIRLAISHGDKKLTVQSFSNEPFWPPFFKGTDISDDSKYWVNMCVASYYKLDEIKLDK